jgi:hypothetical protein
MYNWEHRLTTRDSNRVVRPFEWGLDWIEQWPVVNGNRPGDDPAEIEEYFFELNRQIVERSDEFYSYKTPTDFRLEQRAIRVYATGSDVDPRHEQRFANQLGTFLRFTSPVQSKYPENNVMNARWFPVKGRRAVIVLPQWNSDAISHNALCRIFNMLGIAGLRMSMPYHDIRMPAELRRADYCVSANMGRNIDAARQGITDIRACVDWLNQEGYTEIGILGTSLGSCYAFIASAHDPRLKVNVFNHASTYFGDVIWTGQSTRHVRAGLEPAAVDQEKLRRALLAVSPMAYFDKFSRWKKKSLMIYAKYDLTFLREFSVEIASEFERRKLDTTVKELPCGHYTLGETPYKYMDAWHISRFIGRAFAG